MAKAIFSNKKRSGDDAALARRFLRNLAHWRMFRAGERIGVAVSGGADSVALLRILLELQDELGVVLSVVHLNHKLRGAASDADEKFVAQLAAKHGLDFHLERVDVAAKAKREKANLEDAARRARYDFFSRLIAENKVDRVAVAHTADDQAETVLAHILRGTGLAGLGGIHPETETVVRPLLHARRSELRAYLRRKKQTWREDATNQDTVRLRARIRKRLLPLLEKEFQAAIVEHLGGLAELARDDERFLDWIARERCDALAKQEGHGARVAIVDLVSPLENGDFNTEDTENTENTEKRKKGENAADGKENEERKKHEERRKSEEREKYEALTKRMLRRLIEESKSEEGRSAAQITSQHVAAVLRLARTGENGKYLQLPGGVDVRRDRGELVFLRRSTHGPQRKGGAGRSRPKKRGAVKASSAAAPGGIAYEHQIDFENGMATLSVPQAGCVFRLRVIDWPTNREQTRESGTVLDRGRLRGPLVLRNWRPGDRLQPTGHQKAHKLKRLLNEKHISRWERDGWPVLTSGGELVWVRGFAVAAGYAANAETREGISIAEESLDA